MASYALRCGRFAAVAAFRKLTVRTTSAPVRLLRGLPTRTRVVSLIQPRRPLADDAHAISVDEVENRVIDVLKKFDKVDPSKVI